MNNGSLRGKLGYRRYRMNKVDGMNGEDYRLVNNDEMIDKRNNPGQKEAHINMGRSNKSLLKLKKLLEGWSMADMDDLEDIDD